MRRPALAIALLHALPALLALAVFGVIETPDSPGYTGYAAQILRGAVPAGAALLREAPAPLSLFRMPGYPALLAALTALLPGAWRFAAVLLQVAAQSAVAVGGFRTALALGARPRHAAAAALLPAVGYAAVVQVSVLTDALTAAAATGAALLLARGRGWRAALGAGALLALATAMREATPFVAVFFLPLAWRLRPRAASAALALLPALLVMAAQAGWNAERGAGPVVTTSRQTVMVQAVLPLLKRGLPVYDGDAPFDRAARATVGGGEYAEMDRLHAQLFADGMTAPEMAAAASRRYAAAWRRFPLAMLGATLGNFRREYLAMPFQPVDTAGALMVHAGWPRPVFDRLNLLWAAARGGSAAAPGWIALDLLTRGIGTAATLLALAAPTLDRDPRLLGLWCVVAGFVAVYLPVHIETRYLVPAVPLVCVLAAVAATRLRARRVGRRGD